MGISGQFLRRIMCRYNGCNDGRLSDVLNIILETMRNSRSNPRMQKFKEAFDDSEANYSESEGARPMPETVGRPIQLIRIDRRGQVSANPEALQIIAGFGEPVGFVSLAGKTRTGKSCLLNRLLGIHGEGFRVESETKSCTEGIWMWSVPFENKRFGNLIFFLDTEGTDSLNKNPDNDAKIMTLAVLISSFFIYNSVGSIDESALGELEMVTALSKRIKTGDEGETDAAQLGRFMPKFLWLLRDFMLQIEDKNFRKITPSAYLQNCLRDETDGERSRRIKRGIISYFPVRDCVTLVRPVGEQELLQRLNGLEETRLRREFVEGVNLLLAKIIEGTGPKMYGGKEINGYGMAVMIGSYVEAFNSGGVPNIRSAWEQIANDQGVQAYNRALEVFEQMLQKEVGEDVPHGEDIYKIVGRIRNETVGKFKEEVGPNLKEQQTHLQKLERFLDEQQREILRIDDELCVGHNNGLINSLSLKLRKRIQSNFYANAEGRTQLAADIEQVQNGYRKQALGKTSGDILAGFVTALTVALVGMKTEDTNAQAELQRQRELGEREAAKKMKMLQAQNESLKSQKAAKERTENLKTGKMARKETGKDNKDETEKKEKQGCCAGGCLLM